MRKETSTQCPRGEKTRTWGNRHRQPYPSLSTHQATHTKTSKNIWKSGNINKPNKLTSKQNKQMGKQTQILKIQRGGAFPVPECRFMQIHRQHVAAAFGHQRPSGLKRGSSHCGAFSLLGRTVTQSGGEQTWKKRVLICALSRLSCGSPSSRGRRSRARHST